MKCSAFAHEGERAEGNQRSRREVAQVGVPAQSQEGKPTTRASGMLASDRTMSARAVMTIEESSAPFLREFRRQNPVNAITQPRYGRLEIISYRSQAKAKLDGPQGAVE